MIITFERLQRLSRLERPTAVARWLQRQAIAYIKDAEGRPFTTLAAINERLQAREHQERPVRPDYAALRRRPYKLKGT